MTVARRDIVKSDIMHTFAVAIVTLLVGVPPAAAETPKIGDPPEASNMRLVGFNDLQGRSAYQPTIHHQGDRWIAYIGHHGGTDAVPKPINPLSGQAEFNDALDHFVRALGKCAQNVLAGLARGMAGAHGFPVGLKMGARRIDQGLTIYLQE